MPPRCLKSITVSVAWVAFMLGQDPTLKFIVVSYSEKLAEELTIATRKIMESGFYRAAFPDTVLDKRTNLHLTTTKGGGRFATSIGGALTGFGANWIIVDDPHSAAEIHSEAKRNEVIRFFTQSLLSRFDNPAMGRLILVMQRLHEFDLAGHLIALGYPELRLQAIATEAIEVDTGDSQPHQVKVDDLLHADWLPRDLLDKRRQMMGSHPFFAQYLQDPTPEEGLFFKRDWFKRYQIPPPPEVARTQSWDTAFSSNADADFSVCTTFAFHNGKHHLLDVFCKQLERDRF